MKKFLLSTAMALMSAAVLLPVDARAERIFEDSFDYPIGNLYGQGKWVKYGSHPEIPIQVIDESLSYPKYADTATGKAVKLDNSDVNGQDLVAKFTEGSEVINSGSVYYSALIKVTNVTDLADKNNLILAFIQKVNTTTDVSDGKSGTEYAKLFVARGSSENKFKFGVDRSSLKPTFTDAEYDLNTTYLVVVKYKFNDSSTYDDEVSLFINPTYDTTEPTADVVFVPTSGGDSSRGFQGIELRQGKTGSKGAPAVVVDELRVATSYESLFGKGTVSEQPVITVSKSTIGYNYAYIGEQYTETINVKAVNLGGDISVSGLTSGEVTVSSTTIPKAEAESADGYNLTITLSPTKTDSYMDEVILTEGTAEKKISIFWSPVQLENVANLKDFASKNLEDFGTYKYTGEAVVTFVSGKNYYIQDKTGGLRVNDQFNGFANPPKTGDKITGFYVTLENAFGVYALPVYGTPLTVLAENQSVEPKVITLADLKANASNLLCTLVTVNNATFKSGAGTTVTTSTNLEITDGSGNGRMKAFAEGSDIAGYVIPETAVNITGISTSESAAIISPRGKADITASVAEDPAIEITKETIFTGTAAELNKATQLVKFKVNATALPKAFQVYISGKNGAMFSLSQEEIPAGTSQQEIILTYTPTAIGKHECRVVFDPEVEGLYQAETIKTVCIDPANPPTITVTPATLPDFSAKVGETQEQTVAISPKGLPDYIYVKTTQGENGAFRTSNTMLMNNVDGTLKITFSPKVEGEFTANIEISSLEAETVVLTVKGKTTSGADPTDKEGDELPLVTTNPLTLLNEKFDAITSNKPIKIDGWKNLAMTGKRAWWGYEFKDGEQVTERTAKVTAYDSTMPDGESEDCTMMLVTPALDYKNATSKIFTFRVMGNMLREDQTDLLELCYIDMEGGEMYVAPVQGITMPAIADLNEEWQEFHVNLENQDIADVFFMGFRFKSQRGKDNSAIYYIDDVTYGRNDLAYITPSVAQLAFEAVVNADAISEEISITAKNATEPIKLTIGGANKSKFALTVSELPKEGGSFAVKFHSDQEGVHEAYVKISTRGAADVYIPISVNNKKNGGIDSILFSETPDITVYDLTGRAVKTELQCHSKQQIYDGLNSGIYIIESVGKTSKQVLKIMVP